MSSVLTAVLLGSVASTTLNDGWYAYHGNPAAVDGKHPTIQMVSEAVTVIVGDESSDVVTDFVFHNSGAATTVRMGFPDGGANDDANEARHTKSGVMTDFRSTVDGRPVKTRFVSDRAIQKRLEYPRWQVKDVPFARGQTRKIRNTYGVSHGADAATGTPVLSVVSYIVSTGRTWKGTIKSATFSFTFTKKALPIMPRFLIERDFDDVDRLRSFWTENRDAVLYRGPGSVRKDGRTITFSVKDFVPRTDIFLKFRPRFS
ncbi:MAG: hypothetical protein JST30_03775 [Armatimonadetes bacterium]|nr:hypothetical protein [Armatimonadota bacterium]